MNPLLFLELARRLKGSSDEADRRTAVSRAYYSLFNVIKESLTQAGVVFRDSPEDHGRLVRDLTDADSRFKPIGAALKDLRDERNGADYNMRSNFDEKKTEFNFQKADKTIHRFKGLDQLAISQLAERIKAKT